MDKYSKTRVQSLGSSDNTGTSVGISVSRSVSTGTSRATTYDRCIRDARIALEWNLEDLGDCLSECDDLTLGDLSWYLTRAIHTFQNALRQIDAKRRKHKEESNGEDS